MVDHDFDRRPWTSVLTELLEDGIGMRRVMNHAERVDQIVRLDRNKAGEFFGVARAKSNSVFQPKDGGARAGQLHGFFGEIDGGDLRAGAGEVNRICPDAAADFEHLFATPSLELREPGDVVFHEVFASLHLVEVFLRTDGCSRMTNVTRTTVPVILYPRDFDFVKTHVVLLPFIYRRLRFRASRPLNESRFDDPTHNSGMTSSPFYQTFSQARRPTQNHPFACIRNSYALGYIAVS